jgi:hypothetical protein
VLLPEALGLTFTISQQVCLVVNAIILLPVEGFEVFSNAVELVGIPYLLMK